MRTAQRDAPPAPVEVLGDFAGASLGAIKWRGAELLVALRQDPVTVADGLRHDYNSHFVFGLRNPGASPRRVRVLVNALASEPLERPALIYESASLEAEFHLARFPARYDGYTRYCLEPTLEPGQTLFVANTCFRPPARLVAGLEEAAAANGWRREVFGRSLQGRELVAYHLGAAAPERPVVLITSGFHPPEPDTLVSEALLRHLGSPGWAPLRERFAFVIVPVVNPDGFFLGTQGHNAAGVNLYWDFRPRERERCPEAHHLWRLALGLRPVLYFDFHAYTFQVGRKHASPYLKPLWFYSGRPVRRVVEAINRRLLAYTGGHAMRGLATVAPSTLGARLTRTLNTITYAKYHVHLADGPEECREHGLAVVRLACEALLEAGVRRPAQVLKRPYGGQPRAQARAALCRAYTLWEGPLKARLRPLAALLRRGGPQGGAAP